jgi:hypothetical protein
MTIVALSPAPILQFFNNLGQPNSGGSILTQVGGINTATYQDPAGATPLPNPIPLNSRGEVSNAGGATCQLFLTPGITYTFTLFDANGNQLNQAIYVASNAAAGANSDITSLSALTSINGGQIAGLRNALINPLFNINQRGVSGTVTLAAGAYGHDRWKAGAGGCTYTFSTASNVTTLNISAGTLQQVIEGSNLQSGTRTLSWAGTATARIDAGGYGASGLQGTAVGGTNQTIEFGTGTVSLPQYEPGTKATVFEQRPYGMELALCQRYYEKSYGDGVAPGSASIGGAARGIASSGIDFYASSAITFKVTKRVTPTFNFWSPPTGNPNVFRDETAVGDVGVPAALTNSTTGATLYNSSALLNAGRMYSVQWTASAEL